MVTRSSSAESPSGDHCKVQCVSGCVMPPFLDPANAAHVCEVFNRAMHSFCVHAPGVHPVGGIRTIRGEGLLKKILNEGEVKTAKI